MLREYAGAARETTLDGAITLDAMVLVLSDGTDYPTGATGPFVLTLEAGQVGEEKVLCTSRSGDTITVDTRGWDDTTAVAHANGVSVAHTFSATDAREANEHVNDTTGDPHPQYSAAESSGAIVGKTGDQALTTATVTTLTWDTESSDTDDYHSNVTNNDRMTVPSDGRYLLTCNLYYASNATGYRLIAFYKNGVTVMGQVQLPAVATTNTNLGYSTVVSAVEGDYFHVVGYQNSGGSLNVLTPSSFTITRLGD